MDQTVKPKNEVEQLFLDLDKPSLHGLSYVLRHPDTWPKGFVWDYKHCSSCAMGLAHLLWESIPLAYVNNGPTIMAKNFSMPYADAEKIFLRANNVWGPFNRSMNTVTPDKIANMIDKYLASAE